MYRIKETIKTNFLGGEEKTYIIQVKFLWWWRQAKVPCVRWGFIESKIDFGWEFYGGTYTYNNIETARKHLKLYFTDRHEGVYRGYIIKTFCHPSERDKLIYIEMRGLKNADSL